MKTKSVADFQKNIKTYKTTLARYRIEQLSCFLSAMHRHLNNPYFVLILLYLMVTSH